MSYLNQEVFIRNGREQHWFVDLFPGKVRLQAVGDRRLYCGLFDEATYRRAKSRGPLRFPFRFGSDRTAFDRTYDIAQRARYYVVVRVGAFNPPGGNIHVILDPAGW